MKKIVRILIMVSVLATTVISCTEDNVKPNGGDGPAGGGVIDPLR